jgi:hypothetical protein
MGSPRSAPLLTLLSAPAVAAYTAAGFWGDETIYCLVARHAVHALHGLLDLIDFNFGHARHINH